MINKQKSVFQQIIKKQCSNNMNGMTNNDKIIQNQDVVQMQMEQQEKQLKINQKYGVFEQLQVISEQKLSQQEQVSKRGGYFVVKKKKFTIKSKENTLNNNQQCSNVQDLILTKILAQKKLSTRKQLGTIYKYEQKLNKQIQLVQYLTSLSPLDASHFARYYLLRRQHFSQMVQQMQQQNFNDDGRTHYTFSTHSSNQNNNNKAYEQTLYMDYYQQSLQQYLKNNKDQIDLIEIIDLLKQIMWTVKILHDKGIIHRDLKPGNFMVQNVNDSMKTKLIDYGQSTHESYQYKENQYLGFSVNYAPLECTYQCKQGFNHKQVDLWSLGVIIFEMINKRLPLTYSKCFKKDIITGWQHQINFCVNQRNSNKLQVIQNMLTILAMRFMKVKPKERLNVNKGIEILEKVQKLSKQLCV